ncbi:MAG: FAD-binding oxidoreductase [Planctomycetota bacterium]|nr:FAD-binding oxidoreductase [Planctomycetota bacterium]
MDQTLTQSGARVVDGADALADLVRRSAAQRLPLVDYGRAHQGLGNPPPGEHVAFSQVGGILDHYERDFTVRAAAGARLGDLQAALFKTRQFLPIDADEDLSLGEVISHHVYGGLRAGYGSVRDHLLGLRYIDCRGQLIQAGGRTVKNVAGYDVTRFLVGGLGQFGAICEATIRTYAVPEQTMVVDLDVADPAGIDAKLSPLLLSDATPAWMILTRRKGEWALQIGYFGRLTGCVAQLHALEVQVSGTDTLNIAATSTSSTLERDLGDLARQRAWRRSAGALVKIVVPPASTGATAKALAAWADEAEDADELLIDAMPVHGCLWTGGNLTGPAAQELDQVILKLIAPVGGLRVWANRPADALDIAPFAPVQPDWPMLQRLLATLDPLSMFNPGRFLKPETAKP